MSPDQARTLFHEFGHALHSLLSRTEFQHLAGEGILSCCVGMLHHCAIVRSHWGYLLRCLPFWKSIAHLEEEHSCKLPPPPTGFMWMLLLQEREVPWI